jgi:hypothetical protein
VHRTAATHRTEPSPGHDISVEAKFGYDRGYASRSQRTGHQVSCCQESVLELDWGVIEDIAQIDTSNEVSTLRDLFYLVVCGREQGIPCYFATGFPVCFFISPVD